MTINLGEKGIMDLFSAPLAVRLELDGEEEAGRCKYHRVVIPASSNEVGKQESCLIYHDGDSISGKVTISRRSNGPISHGPVNIHLTGVIEPLKDLYKKAHTFLSSSLCLSTTGVADSSLPISLPFNFGAIGLPYESFEGEQIQIRYALRVAVRRTFSDLTVERTVWVQRKEIGEHVEIRPCPVSMNLGLDTALHLQIELGGTTFKWNDIIRGKVSFQLVLSELASVDLILFRREMLTPGPPPSTGSESPIAIPAEGEILARHQVMEGGAQRGDVVPFRFHLASCLDEHATLTRWDEKGLFSIRYFLFITIRDMQERQFYKIQEIHLVR